MTALWEPSKEGVATGRNGRKRDSAGRSGSEELQTFDSTYRGEPNKRENHKEKGPAVCHHDEASHLWSVHQEGSGTIMTPSPAMGNSPRPAP